MEGSNMPVVYSIGTGIPGTAGVADLTLDPVQQLGYEQVPVWDGPTYLYTIHRMHFRGIYNPASFAWNIAQNVPLGGDYTGLYPILSPGSLAPITNDAIRHYLLHPRGTLTYNIGGIVQPIPGGSTVVISGGMEALRSPTNVLGADDDDSPASYTVDCKNGPVPLHCNVVEVRGKKTFVVDWAIECYVNESYIFRRSTTLSALLSQRWTVEEDLDQDFFATRIINGHAIFRSDRLQILNAVADDFRAWLMNPPQNNFRRTVQQILISEDGTRLDYVLIDRQVPYSLTPTVIQRGVTRFEAEYTQGYIRRVSGEQAILDLALAGASGIATAVGKGGNLASAIKGYGLLQLPKALDFIPRFQQHLICRVWGNQNSTRASLYQTSLEVLTSKISAINTRLGSGSISVTEDLAGKFIQLDCSIELGPIRSLYQSGGSFVALPVVDASDLIPGVTQSEAFLQPLPPLDHGTRSNFYAAVAQVLTGGDDTTPLPNNNRAYNSLTPQGVEF